MVCVVSSRSPSTLTVSLPAVRAVDRHHHGIAGLVFRLVDRGFQQIRRIRAAIGIPADIELHRGHRSVGLGRFHVQTITSRPAATTSPATGLVGGDGEIAIGNPRGRLDRFIVPRRILAIPLIAGFHLQEFVPQAVARQRFAVGRDEHDVESRPCLPRPRSCRRIAA